MEQPTALRLADILEDHIAVDIDGHWSQEQVDRSAAELRRLHALNQELLEALKELVAQNETSMFAVQISGASLSNARAAIAKATGEKQ